MNIDQDNGIILPYL